MNSDTTRHLSRLGDLLDEERHAVLAGDMVALERIGQLKVKAAEAIRSAGTSIDPDLKKNILDKAAHNQQLLSAASEGLKTAMARLDDLASATSQAKTYRSDGSHADMTPPTSQHDRRA